MRIRTTPIQTADSPKSDLEPILKLVSDEMVQVNQLIERRLRSDIALISQLSAYLVHSGGKRLRPLTVLLAAGACQHRGSSQIALAAVVEFIHTATLLHDDVVDASELRRGRATANSIWGNESSVLVGDFLYSRAFEMMVEVGNMRVMEIMATTTNQIAEGEVMQLLNIGSPDTTEAQYLETIRRKTAKLFETAAQLGAVISNQSTTTEQALARYGLHLGTAFQLIDDVLDYSADSAALGKNIGDDLAEGKPTLPVINAIQRGSDTERRMLRDAIERGGLDRIDDVVAAIESTGSLAYTARRARQQAELARKALGMIPDTPYKQALSDLAVFAVERGY